MSGFEIVGAAAAALQFAEASYKSYAYIKRFIKNGKHYYEQVERLGVKLDEFGKNLKSFSLAAKTVEISKFRSQDETTVYANIVDGLRGSKETLDDLFTRWGEIRKPGTRSSIKLAVKYWCYEREGQKVVNKGLNEIDTRITTILSAIHSITLMISNANRDLGHEILNRIDDIHNGRGLPVPACSDTSKLSTDPNDSVVSNDSVFSHDSRISQSSRASTVDCLSPPPPYSEKWDLHLMEGEDPERDILDLSQDIIDKIEGKEKDYKGLRKLIKAGQDPFGENDQGWCALHYAARRDSKTIIQELLAYEKLRKNKQLVDRRNIHGATALHFAASLGAKNSVKELVKFGADVNAMDGVQQSPLYVAAVKNREEVFEILLNAGARFEPSVPRAAQKMLNNIADRKAIYGR